MHAATIHCLCASRQARCTSNATVCSQSGAEGKIRYSESNTCPAAPNQHTEAKRAFKAALRHYSEKAGTSGRMNPKNEVDRSADSLPAELRVSE